MDLDAVRSFIFKEEQNEYKADGIDVAHVDFVDNQICLDLIEGKGQPKFIAWLSLALY